MIGLSQDGHAAPFLTATGRAIADLDPINSAATGKVLNNAIGNATMLAFSHAIVAAMSIATGLPDGPGMVRAFADAVRAKILRG